VPKFVADSSTATGLAYAAPAGGGGMTLLNSGNTTLSGSTFTISSISGIYNDLVLNIYGVNPSSATAILTLTFNSDTATNYPHANNDYVPGTSNNTMNQENANGITLNRFGRSYLGQNTDNFWRYNIFGYTRTGNRTLQETFSQDPASAVVGYGAINYEGSSAITEVTLTLDTGTFSAGTLEVYGVK
jgi:hypothetical protein